MSRKVVSVVGMAGAGKSEVARVFEDSGFTRVRFGDITDMEVKKRSLALNEESERYVRELLRKEHGMAAYARLSLPTIDSALKHADVVIDGLYSWEEYTFLKGYFKDRFSVVAVWASPQTRYARLANRAVRPLTAEEAASRDEAEIRKLNKSAPIVMADFTILNDSSLKNLEKEAKKSMALLRRQD